MTQTCSAATEQSIAPHHRRHRYWRWVGTVLLVLAAVGVGRVVRRWRATPAAGSVASKSKFPTDGATAARGAMLYSLYCEKCHGPEGRGDGEGIAGMARPPRDFASEQWRLSPTQASIAQVISEGIAGTPMPASRQVLSPADCEVVAEHVLALRERGASRRIAPSRRDAALSRLGFSRLRTVPATPLQLEDVGGGLRTVDFQDGRPRLLHFWGTNCPHCLREFPQLVVLEQALSRAGASLEIISVCGDEPDPAEAERIGRPVASNHPLFVDAAGLAMQQYQVQALPYAVLIDGQGMLRADRLGAGTWEADVWLSEFPAALETSSDSPLQIDDDSR